MPLKQIDSPRGSFRVFSSGSGPPLLFVHGFPLDHRMWAAQLSRFARDFHVIAPDLRGFGGSPSVSDDAVLKMEDFADDLSAVLDALGVTEPVRLCGLSMGGYIAFQFWMRHRRRLARLILCDTKAAADTEAARETRFKTARLALEHGARPIADTMSSKLFAPRTPPEVLAEVREMILASSAAGIAAASRGMAERPDVTPWLPQIDVPTTLICGEYDSITPPEEMITVAAAIPTAKYVEIPDAGHMSPMENSLAFNAAIGSVDA